MINPHLPLEAEVVERIEESPTIVTLRLRLTDADARQGFRFSPGQFNMLYLPLVGEVPISIKSGPRSPCDQPPLLDHSIRAVAGSPAPWSSCSRALDWACAGPMAEAGR